MSKSKTTIIFFAIVQCTVSDLLTDSNLLGLEWKSPGSSSSLKYCQRRGLNRCPLAWELGTLPLADLNMAKKLIGSLLSNNSQGIIQRMREKTSEEYDEPEIICNNNFLLINSTRTWAWKLDHICQTFNQRSEEFEVIGSPFGVSQRRKKNLQG